MTTKICLLITDDADDHQAFSEALSEYEKTVVLNVLDGKKALEFLRSQRVLPDYIFIDLSMHGIKINTMLKQIKNEVGIRPDCLIVYGDDEDFEKIENNNGLK